MLNKKRITAIAVFLGLSLMIITMAGGRSELLLYVIFMDKYDGNVISEQRIPDGEDAIVPDDPYHENYVFAGWYLYGEDDVKVEDFTNIRTDLKVEARYKTDLNNNSIADEDDEYFTISFVDGVTREELKSETVLTGMDATAPDVKTHANYRFAGFDLPYTNVTSNMVITALYDALNVNYTYYTLNFYDKDNILIDTQIIRSGLSGTQIKNVLQYEGYTLIGFYEEPNGNGNIYRVGSRVTKNVNYYGYYTKTKYEITINPNGGLLVNTLTKYNIEYAEEFVLPSAVKDYVLKLNLNGGVLTSGETNIISGATMLGYCKNKITCTEDELILPGETVIVKNNDTYNAIWGSSQSEIALPSATKTSTNITNYEFMGWSLDNVSVTYSLPKTITLDNNLELFAVYKENTREYNLNIITDGGDFIDTNFINNANLSYGSKVLLPSLEKTYKLTYHIGDDEVLGGNKENDYNVVLLGYCRNSETCDETDLILPNSEITITELNNYYAIWGKTSKIDLFGVAKSSTVSEKYTLSGYATTLDGEVEYVLPSSIYLNNNLDLYSIYQASPRKYSLIFDLDGGTLLGEVNYTNLDYNSEYTLPGATKDFNLTLNLNGGTLIDNKTTYKTKATLLGYQKNNEETIIAVGTVIKVTDNDTYKAVWTKSTDGTELPSPTKTADESNTYVFSGWSTTLNGKVVYKTPKTIYLDNNLELFATYNEALAEHIITFDANKGTMPANTETTKTVLDGETIALPIPTRNYLLTYNANGGVVLNSELNLSVGATFMGWCEDTKSCETPIKDKLTVTKSATYYAVWGNSISQIKLASAKKDATKAEIYEFNYWRGSSVFAYKAGKSLTLTNDMTLNAYYKATARKYTVTYRSAFGDLPASENVLYNGNATNPGDLVSEGKTFLGWYETLDSNTKWDFTEDKVTDNLTLYGKWDVDTYSLIYELNGGVLATNNQGVYEENAEITLPTITKNYQLTYVLNGGVLDNLTASVNVRFKGWCKNSEVCEEVDLVMSGTKVKMTSNTIYYAIWETKSENYLLETPTKLSTNTTNYTFSYWNNNETKYNGKEVINLTNDLTLEANYSESERKYTVTFDSDYGTIPNSQLVSYEGLVDNPGELSNETHTFLGWYQDEAKTILWDFATNKIATDTIIYASWSE